MLATIQHFLKEYREHPEVSVLTYRKGQSLYLFGQVQLLSQGKEYFSFLIDDEYEDIEVRLKYSPPIGEEEIGHIGSDKASKKVEHQHVIAAMMQLADECERLEKPEIEGITYTREGMIRRVLEERKAKANKAEYRITFSDNPHGEHELLNERGQRYRIMFRDREAETGYCTCPDFQTNKLGTCKHLMAAYAYARKANPQMLIEETEYPFLEIYLDPIRDYQIAWYGRNPEETLLQELLATYFDEDQLIRPDQLLHMAEFFQQVAAFKQVVIRPEVSQVVEKAYDRQLLDRLADQVELDFSCVKATLFPHQKEGVRFATFKDAVIIADEMGLGKTLQAITTAILKKQLLGFTRTLIICPASLKNQWKKEIEKFSDEQAEVVEGFPEYRAKRYQESEAYFLIINYETVLRDWLAIETAEPDFIVLDEAQRIKNYETRTAHAVKQLPKKHALVITGTPIENKLIDLFSIMDFLNPRFLTPLWEFSYQHCYFDPQKKNRITGYYNLQALNERMKPFLLRREKRQVLQDLPNLTQIDVPLKLHPYQEDYHRGFAGALAKIITKKFLTAYDINRILMLLNQMRMTCDSTFLIDKETNHSPKLEELRHILTEKLDVKGTGRKILIFSEWVRMNGLIGRLLREEDIGFTELNGKVPVKKRQALVDEFFQNPDCQVFLSTEAGGAGLNLQAADTVINFELPWNPAKKNQRIGRIDRLGQTSEHLTVINLIMQNSIETKIATGLALKQNLFDGVLNEGSQLDVVDFSSKGRSQFLKQLENMLDDMERMEAQEQLETESELRRELAEVGQEIEDDATGEPLAANPTLSPTKEPEEPVPPTPSAPAPEQVEEVMNQGMNFLAGLFKMATGKDMGLNGKGVEVNRETGEVVMRFQLPTQS
ncbi:MAG: DEAD/DEAH box helicase [Bacteroidota bacterium]